MPTFIALDSDGNRIGGLYDSRDSAAGACQDAAREAGDDGEGYTVEAAPGIYTILARCIGTGGNWEPEGSYDRYATAEEAEEAVRLLERDEPTNDDGSAMEYRAAKVG